MGHYASEMDPNFGRPEPAKPGSLERVVGHPCEFCKLIRPAYREIKLGGEWKPLCQTCATEHLLQLHKNIHAVLMSKVRMPNSV